MKRKTFLTLIICWLGCTLHAQSYETLWNQVEQLKRKDLPQSVIEQTQAIYRKAMDERNTPQMMKAFLTAMGARNTVSADSFYVDLQRLEEWVATPELNATDAAVLHSLLGEIYQQNATRGTAQTVIVSELPEKVSQWSRLMYRQRAYEHYQASTTQTEVLFPINAQAYSPLTKTGQWSDYDGHSLAILIGRRAVEGLASLKNQLEGSFAQTPWSRIATGSEEFAKATLLPASAYDCTTAAMSVCRELLRQMEEAGQEEARLLMELHRLELTGKRDDEAGLQALLALQQQYAGREVCAEVHATLARLYCNRQEYPNALATLREGIKRYPRYGRINVLKNLEQEVLHPSLNLNNADGPFYPGTDVTLHISHRNLDGFDVRILHLTLPTDSVERHANEPTWLKQRASLHSKHHFALTRNRDYLLTDTTLTIRLPEAGIYLMELKADGQEAQPVLFNVTRLRLLKLQLSDKQTEFIVVDNRSGHPIPHATIHAGHYTYKQGTKTLKRFTTDEKGSVTIANLPEANRYRATTNEEQTMLYRYGNNSTFMHLSEKQEKTHGNLFTDRTLYRPGQTVYAKGLIYRQLQDSLYTMEGDTYTFILNDVNHKEVSRREVTTNRYGTVSTEFVLPTHSLNGRFTLHLKKDNRIFASTVIYVESYKRPTYEVTFDTLVTAYAIGDTVIVSGRAQSYTQTPLAHANVSYRIQRNRQYGRMVWSSRENDATQLAADETTTDEEGRFRIAVYLAPDERESQWSWWQHTYTVTATVTSAAGESHDAKTTLHLSNIPLTLDIALEQLQWQKGTPHPLTFHVRNLSGNAHDARVTYILRQRDALGDKVLEATVDANKPLEISEADHLPDGVYHLTAYTTWGPDTVRQESSLTLYDYHATHVPDGLTEWNNWTAEEFAPGEPARLQFGTTKKDVYVFYDLFTETERIESRRFVMSDTVQTFTYDYRPEYGKGLRLYIRFIQEGKIYRYNHTINLKRPDKRLEMKWETFRDRLRPGQQEEWTLHLATPDGKPADAEMLASMYDASLDYFAHQSDWEFRLYFLRLWNQNLWQEIGSNPHLNSHISFPFKPKEVPAWSYDNFDSDLTDFGYTFQNTLFMRLRGRATDYPNNDAQLEETTAKFSSLEIVNEPVTDAAPPLMAKSNNGKEPSPTSTLLPTGMALRENFNETAFFQPHLLADPNGEVKVSFTLPESLTRWRFRAFAHTPEMRHAMLEEEITVEKEFTIQPNLPRFIRQGDRTTLTATLSNQTDTPLNGTARMELFDPATERVLVSREATFSLASAQTDTVSFSFILDENDVTLPACRIVADAGTYSDGEQRYLPLLTNRVWMTESVPLILHEAGKSTHSLRGLFNKQSHTTTERRLTIEFTNNPMWLAIQALPDIDTPTQENALAWAAAWYARTMATHLVQTNPRIKAVVNSWRTETSDRETLWSNLQRNEELKTLLLEETPWLAEAANETEQKARLALLFDTDNTVLKNELCLKKLQELQTHEGGWSWYKKMPANRHVTTYIVELMERALRLTGQHVSENAQFLLEKATAYLKNALQQEYEAMLRAEKEGRKSLRPSEAALHFLYIQALNDKQEPKEQTPATDYMIGQIPGLLTSFSLYGKAQAALILHYNGAIEEANAFLNSLTEHSVYTPENGRYFDTPQFTYSWRNLRIPTQVAAIEALATLRPQDSLTIREMQQWLLIQKRAQSWDNALNTVDAVHALLMYGGNPLQTEKPATLKLDNLSVDPKKRATDGTGYTRRTYSGKELERWPKKLTVNKPENSVSWGAVYAQYLEEMERVEQSSGTTITTQPLRITRNLLVERIEKNRTVWYPVSDTTQLHPGDKLISRLTVTTDRDMDFIQLKDSRAACTEPLSSASGYHYDGNLGYYREVKDAATFYFFDHLYKGTYVIDTPMRIDRRGTYQSGIATIQCAYAPEFTAHSAGAQIRVE